MNSFTDIARSEGDPTIIKSGPSSLGMSDGVARGLGWFSLGLGLTQLLGAGRVTRLLGMEGSEAMMRACGAREIASGLLVLSVDKQVGLWSRVAGDAADVASLLAALREENPKRDNVAMALGAVLGVALLDLAAATATTRRHHRPSGPHRDYSDRSGFPRGVAVARGAARKGA